MVLVGAILLAVFVVPSPWGIPLVVGGAAVEVGEALFWIHWSRRRRAVTGAEALVGAEAEVVDERFVRLAGELWQADGLAGRRAGERVRVVRVDGLRLDVE